MKIKALVLSLAILLTVSSSSWAGMMAYMTIIGETQGLIQGSVTRIHLEGTIGVIGYNQIFNTEPDPRSCIAGEVRNHFPLTIIKELDKATVPLFTAWRNHESLEVEIKFYTPSATGQEVQYYTILLRGAFISGIQKELLNIKNPDLQKYAIQERVSFTYGNIREIWMPGTGETIEASDDWRANCARNNVFSDLNFDGIVNILDFSIMADQWLMQSF